MPTSAHDRYRDRLAVLAAMQSPVWSRHFARFEPSRAPWATLVHRLDGPYPFMLTTEVYEGHIPRGAVETDAGPAVVRTFPDDPQLPGLARVVRQAERYQILRYRPHERCTLRVTTPQGVRYVKVVRDGDPARLFDDSSHLWHASRTGTLPVRVAMPDRADVATGAVWHHEVGGEPIRDRLFGADGPALAFRLGEVLGRLAAAPLAPAVRTRRGDQVARTARAVGRAALALPALDGRLRDHAQRLAAEADALPPERLLPIHGSPRRHRWLIDGEQLGLVDFDRYALGEPELDLATFLAELEDETDLQTSVADLQAAMTSGFEEAGPRVEPAVVAWYRAHKRLATVIRTGRALRPDGDVRAARHLAAFEASLGARCPASHD